MTEQNKKVMTYAQIQDYKVSNITYVITYCPHVPNVIGL